MRTESEVKLQRIKRISTVLRFIFKGLLALNATVGVGWVVILGLITRTSSFGPAS